MSSQTTRRTGHPSQFGRPFAKTVSRFLNPPGHRASALNTALYAEVDAISPTELSRLTSRLETFGKVRNYPEKYLKAWLLHSERLFLSFQRIRELLAMLPTGAIGLECGHASVFTDVLLEDLPEVRWTTYHGDLRDPWTIEESSVDLIICTEVLEHLSDPPSGLQSEFWSTGLKQALKQVHRALKPGGIFFATTPNVASILHFRLLAEGASPWFCSPHVREYTVFQMILEFAEAGLDVFESRTVHCMTSPDRYDYTPHFRALLEMGGFTEHRGDDLFLSARRPA